jgi:putative transcriptional regulator
MAKKTIKKTEVLNRIKGALSDKGKTSEWLKDQMGVSQSTVSHWCTNSNQPSLSDLKKISEVLQIDVKELLTF